VPRLRLAAAAASVGVFALVGAACAATVRNDDAAPPVGTGTYFSSWSATTPPPIPGGTDSADLPAAGSDPSAATPPTDAPSSTPTDSSWTPVQAGLNLDDYLAPITADAAALQTLAGAGSQDVAAYVSACGTLVGNLATLTGQLSSGAWPAAGAAAIDALGSAIASEQSASAGCASATSIAEVFASLSGMQTAADATQAAYAAAKASFE
jgi:hypothetical protein